MLSAFFARKKLSSLKIGARRDGRKHGQNAAASELMDGFHGSTLKTWFCFRPTLSHRRARGENDDRDRARVAGTKILRRLTDTKTPSTMKRRSVHGGGV